jgi:cytidylate kinase
MRRTTRAQVWLSADVSRRLRAIAARAGLSAEQVLAQLADQARMNDDGRVTVEAFTLSKGEDTCR